MLRPFFEIVLKLCVMLALIINPSYVYLGKMSVSTQDLTSWMCRHNPVYCIKFDITGKLELKCLVNQTQSGFK